ncbi:MAG: hypothetical protein H6658_05295 [Ardenticatenaceae bacterium]|nr:hypothetical protein [Ardenticatenaceae bacterium]
MTTTPYLPLPELLQQIDEPARTGCQTLLAENRALFHTAWGSSHNHQAWPGGYYDHIQEVLNLAVVLYQALSPLRPLPFTLSDALLVLYLHDIEKPWAYEHDNQGHRQRKASFVGKDDQQAFRLQLLQRYNIPLTPAQENGLRYAEGEIGSYSNQRRTMNPLAAFCHMCDVASARVWFDYPLAVADDWARDGRSRA